MSTKLPDVVSRYFERDGDRDIESIVGLFAEDATVIDEGEERHGTAEIRAWQTGAASKYTYTTEITNAEALGPDRYLVTGRLTGNFPGGTADLKVDVRAGRLLPVTFRFEKAGTVTVNVFVDGFGLPTVSPVSPAAPATS